ncbi:DUF4301 family protein [Neptunitalea lumnitzerae]|uniref:DUF4301 domain-containing protein n=1 Tax=Neptunitalea lumnitzerae TaxID=2965509 RepID=A0ABQ5MGB1_9FLAO|nr:DUF4301 family protein [Neptunitalea sp. Y10]GLB48429.1 hypothetical protein Y10_07970 [Neptunitalea sp. Y10]
MMETLTKTDKDVFADRGIPASKIEEQLDIFEEGIPFVTLVAPATYENGIHKISDENRAAFVKEFEGRMNELSLLKFVPASGAASRMFKSVFKFINEYDPEKETFNSYVNREKAFDMNTFFIGVEKFPFYKEVAESLLEKIPNFEDLSDDYQKYHFVRELLLEEGFNFGSYPKGALPFHRYKTHPSTAFEEHLYEAALYATSNGLAKLHLTIAEEHRSKFEDEYEKVRVHVESKTNVKFDISFSYQKKSTDTIAVDMDNNPFREEDGTILFRPGGHGALIENLNDVEADIIFIKNIDNVVVMRYKHTLAEYKKMLAGMLLKIQQKAFEYRSLLDEPLVYSNDIEMIKIFLEEKLSISITPHFKKYKEIYQIEYLKEILDRPIRICGMVKNEGEPGGGPFWVKGEDACISLQIIESAQIDMSSKSQRNILQKSTHFNPVDIVCSVRNYKGEKYDLRKFVDPKQGFITQKTREGKDLKALELPGLWNGAMANWNTIFVEVPLSTFNPVKTVIDLLKPAHQVKL